METPPELSVHDNNLHSYCVDAEKNEIKGYQLSSSLGMIGWVLAKSMSLVSIAS